jgi:rod shape-determining protein MreD
MLRYGYDRRVASGVIAASGTLAQIIPPSLVLIIMADQLGQSVGALYKGAFVPGFVLTGLYVAYVLIVSVLRPSWTPALPAEARTIREDDGRSGLPSLAVLFVLSTALAVYFAKTRPETMPTDELIVVSMCVGVGVAFVFGLLMDVHEGALLGQHALAYTLLSYFAIAMHRRLLWFGLAAQTLQIAPLFFATQLLSLALRLAAGGTYPGWSWLLAPAIESLLWPAAALLLLAPQRRPPDPDANRPL